MNIFPIVRKSPKQRIVLSGEREPDDEKTVVSHRFVAAYSKIECAEYLHKIDPFSISVEQRLAWVNDPLSDEEIDRIEKVTGAKLRQKLLTMRVPGIILSYYPY